MIAGIGLLLIAPILLMALWLEGRYKYDFVRNFVRDYLFNIALIVSAFGSGILLITNVIYDIQQKLKLLDHDTKSLSVKLERVIRAASQAQEHAPDSFAGRIELDLRLADAESALQHYRIVEKKAK